MDVVDKDKEYTLFAGRSSPIVDCVVALAAGVLTTLSAAPFSLWWLGPVAVALVYWKIASLTRSDGLINIFLLKCFNEFV